MPDPDHHRRPALGHRRGRHGPHDAEERDRHLRPRGGSGRRRGRAAAGQDRHHHAGQPPGDRLPAGRRRRPRPNWPTRRSSPRWPTKRRKAAASWCWPSRSSTCASATSHALGATFVPLHRADPHERRRLSGESPDPQGRGRRHPQARRSPGRQLPGRRAAIGRRRRAPRQHAAGGGRRHRRAGRDRAQGHRQGRHQGALRRAAPHGHQDRDDHRRQPPHRRRHRRRSGRGRLPGRGHAGGQAEADPRAPGRRAGWWP